MNSTLKPHMSMFIANPDSKILSWSCTSIVLAKIFHAMTETTVPSLRWGILGESETSSTISAIHIPTYHQGVAGSRSISWRTFALIVMKQKPNTSPKRSPRDQRRKGQSSRQPTAARKRRKSMTTTRPCTTIRMWTLSISQLLMHFTDNMRWTLWLPANMFCAKSPCV